MTYNGKQVNNVSGLIQSLLQKYEYPSNFTMNFYRKMISTTANETGNEEEIRAVDRYLQNLTKFVPCFYLVICLFIHVYYVDTYFIYCSKLLHEHTTAQRSYNAPTTKRALRERQVLDSLLQGGIFFILKYSK